MSKLNIVTFGVKHRTSKPENWPVADYYVDCQKLKDPELDLYSHNGTERILQAYFKAQFAKDPKLLKFWNFVYVHARKLSNTAIGSHTKTVGLYCFGGRHRSVGVSELLRVALTNAGVIVHVEHLDIHRSSILWSTKSHGKIRRSHKIPENNAEEDDFFG